MRGPWARSVLTAVTGDARPTLAVDSLHVEVGRATARVGCCDIYCDRRETIALGADDHLAVNRVAQMVDPWPRYVGNKNLAFNGERMQGAVERYRRHEVIRPIPPTTNTYYQQSAPAPITTEHVSVPQAAAPAAAAPVSAAPRARSGRAVGAPDPAEPVIVHIRDLRSGEMDVFAGESTARLRDPGLAARLAHAVR